MNEVPEVIELGTGAPVEIVRAVELIPAPELAFPVVVVPLLIVEAAGRGVKRAEDLVIDGPESMKAAAELLNNLKKFSTSIKKTALDAGRPYREQSERITDAANEVLNRLSGAGTIVEQKMMVRTRWEQREREKAIEAQRLQREAEDAAQRAALAERTRLEREATQREELAARKIEAANTPGQIDKAVAAGEAAQALRAAAEAVPVPEISRASVVEPLPELTAVKGVKMKKTVVFIREPDVKLLPVAYHVVDEAKVKKHILDGTLDKNTPGIGVFEIRESYAGTGR